MDPGQVVVKSNDLAQFFKYCCDIEEITRGISAALEDRNFHSDLLDSITTTYTQVRKEMNDMPIRLVPCLLHDVRQYKEMLTHISNTIAVDLFSQRHESVCNVCCSMNNFIQDLQRKVEVLLATSRSSTDHDSASFFKNSQNIQISGGIFTANTGTSTPDLILHAQNEKIIRLQYVHLSVLFGYTGRSEWHSQDSP